MLVSATNRGIKLKESPAKEDEPVYIGCVIGERADDFTFVIAAKRRNTGCGHPVDPDLERRELLTEKPNETVIVAIGIRPKAAHQVVVRDVAGLRRDGTRKG